MYTGEVATISNKSDWLSDVVELVDEDDGTTTDLTAVSPLDILVTIKDENGCLRATASISNGKVSVPGPGFQWQFASNDLNALCAGRYGLGVKVTINGFATDLIDGTLSVVEGV
ncbi:hypothetical protein QY049_03285 [Bradyrhizobium sp. WYCCWR 13022]|uniref:hypothetical protein n=1 Tax=unclassified Bradyrhizobium TaxID=2631580 RepID=UPI00263AD317|nr:hypothetical protein [Bradyrhizobium sp. WYCCWR 13022]MDN4982249.1 hypothetical protein [Bradyrhizobium sp. WYCCWR 13022]